MDSNPKTNADHYDYTGLVFTGHDIGYYDFYNTHDDEGPDSANNSTSTSRDAHIGIYTYIVVCSISVVTNSAILLTAISKSARTCSVCWYIYHVIFVTVMRAVVTVVIFAFQTNLTPGLCLFLSFTKLTLCMVNMYIIILMDIEVIRALVGTFSGGYRQTRRYVMTTSGTWILSMLFSVSVIFFNVETHTFLSMCFNLSHSVHVFVLYVTSRIPCGIMILCICTGSVFYIRGKINPEHYQEEEVEHENRICKTEQFVFFILWNFLQVLTTCVQMISKEAKFSNDVIVRACVFVNLFTPCLSLIHFSVRMVIKTSVVSVANFLLGRTNVSPSRVSDIVALGPVK